MADFATLAIKVTTNGAKQASTDLGNLDKSAQKAEKSTQDLTNCLSRLARIVELSGIGLGIKQLLDLTDKMQSMANQVRFATKTVEEFNVVQKQLFELAQNTMSSLESTTQLYVRASQAVKGYGYSQQQVLKFTETINKAMVVGGVGAQEQASALLQLSQALGSGKLQGDEFRSIAEAAPIILDTLATYLGKSREEVKKLATEGKLTSKIIFDAFSGSVRDIEEKFAEMPMSFGGAMQMLQNSAMKFFGELLNGSGITSAFANVIAMVANNLTTFAQILGAIAAGHLVKLTSSIFANIQATIQKINADHAAVVAALSNAKATQAKIAAETASIVSNIQSVSLGGMAHSGIDNVPKEGTWLLDKGERVVDSRTNQDLKTFLANANTGGASGGKSTVNVKIINNGQPVEAKVHSEETADGNLQLTVELMQTMDRIANERYRKNQMNDLRKGGALSR